MARHGRAGSAVTAPADPAVADQAVADRASSDPAIADLAEVFGLLADPGRLRLLVALADGERCVGDLAAAALLSESAASHALRILRAHRVVAVRRSGRMAYYALADEHVRTLLDVALTHVAHSPALHGQADARRRRPADGQGRPAASGRAGDAGG